MPAHRDVFAPRGSAAPGGTRRAPSRAEGRRRPSRRVIRRRRAVVLAIPVAFGIALALALSGGGPGPATLAPAHAATGTTRRVHPRVQVSAALLPWRLGTPLSREAVFPAGGSQVLVAGGLVAGNSETAVDTLDLRTGAVRAAGQLAVATHDAAALALPGRDVVVGGGSAAPAAGVQALRPGATASVTATLPQARADATGTVRDGVGYVVGGYDGPAGDPAVLATGDGRGFSTVAQLAVPVRYGACASLGHALYVFGGTTIGGTPVSTIQRIDLATHRSAVVGHLPVALGGAQAATIGGTVYLAGGRSASGDSTAVYAFSARRASVSLVAHLPVALAYGAGVRIGDHLYLIGGEDSAGNEVSTAEVVTATTR